MSRGIATIADVKDRCVIDDFTGCWHWGGMMRNGSEGKFPVLWIFDPLKRKKRAITGPLAVLILDGRRPTADTMGWRGCQCDDCLNPEHVRGGTKADWGRWVRERGIFCGNPARIAANRRTARERSSLSLDDVKRIRESSLTGRKVAAMEGLAHRHVSHIRTGRIWSDAPMPGASVFTMAVANDSRRKAA